MTVAGTVALPLLGVLGVNDAYEEIADAKSQVFRVRVCPHYDGRLRFVGMDATLRLLSDKGIRFYKSPSSRALMAQHYETSDVVHIGFPETQLAIVKGAVSTEYIDSKRA